MKVLLLHNYYQQPGGEDQVFASEAGLLRAYGHRIEQFVVRNHLIVKMNPLATAKATLWNGSIYRQLRGLVREMRPDAAHFHNTFPLISPAAYYAAKAEGIPVVQTLHNYRLLCPSAVFFREGQICERCKGKTVPWPGIAHACYRGSRAASAGVAAMLTLHRAMSTWTRKVDMYVALTEFARKKFLEGELPADRIVVKPNFVSPDPGTGAGGGRYALFVGRLSPEKGIGPLITAWKRLSERMPLKIVGDGPLASSVGDAARSMTDVEWLGRRPPPEVYDLMGNAACLIVPSECYETFGRVVIEAYAKGTPVIASNIGAIAELVKHGRTGLLFTAGDSEDLAAKVEWACTHPEELAAMRREARAEYETKYTAERNYQMLMEIYRTAIARARERR